jgi:2,4-dienoyl-CoA reductase-like NADH-dependent reductase (Old Yellow Enzyme family)
MSYPAVRETQAVGKNMENSLNQQDAFFTPYSLGNLVLPNRFVMSPMTRSFCPGGVPGADVAAYYRRRAEIGLIITEGAWIPHESASNVAAAPRFYGQDAVSGWTHVLSEVRAAGGRMIPQLWHVGLFGAPGADTSLTASPAKLGPSGYIGGMGRAPYKYKDPMTIAEIEAIVDAYGTGAETAFKLGFDGVALHGAHGYLIDQFLWDKTNHRTDEYGGDIGRRSRFAAEVVRECRRRTHSNFPILLRISQWKLQDYDARLAENASVLEAILAPIVDAGVTLFDCSQRRFWEPAFAEGGLNFAGWVKKITGLPTMTVGSVGLGSDLISTLSGQSSEPSSLDRLRTMLEAGEFDLIGVGRAVLADPNWIDKIRRGAMQELKLFSKEALAALS